MPVGIDAVSRAIFGMLPWLAIYDLAWRENRQRDRMIKRTHKYTTYFAAGLNGDRAMARRRRQIATGHLTVANGLCKAA